MPKRVLHPLLDAMVFVLTMSSAEVVIGATATAIVTVTIVAPTPRAGDLLISSPQIDMRGKLSDELTISNNSTAWHEIRVTLTPQGGDTTACQLHYSPMSASIPPGGMQVVRLLLTRQQPEQCSMEQRLVISDAHDQLTPLFDVPVYAGQ
jgi:hypothetical protein